MLRYSGQKTPDGETVLRSDVDADVFGRVDFFYALVGELPFAFDRQADEERVKWLEENVIDRTDLDELDRIFFELFEES